MAVKRKPLPISHPEGAQTLDRAHAETGPSPDIGEQEKGGGLEEEQEGVSGFADEIDRMAVGDSEKKPRGKVIHL